MSLPYPHEVETGALRPRPRAPRTPFDVEAHVNEAIRVQGGEVAVFGVRMAVPGPDSAQTAAEQLRRAVTEHFRKHFSAPDDDTWKLFAMQAHDQLEGRTILDESTWRTLRLTIDAA